MKSSNETSNISFRHLDAITLVTRESGSSNSNREEHHTTIYFTSLMPNRSFIIDGWRKGGMGSLTQVIEITLEPEQRSDVVGVHSLLLAIFQSMLEKNLERLIQSIRDFSGAFGGYTAVIDYLFQELSLFLSLREMIDDTSNGNFAISQGVALIAQTYLFLQPGKLPQHGLGTSWRKLLPDLNGRMPGEVCLINLDQQRTETLAVSGMN